MARLPAQLALTAMLVLAFTVAPAAQDASGDINYLISPTGELTLPEPTLTAQSYPQALPNDGVSEAEISVQVTAGDEPVAGEVVYASIETGGGMLTVREAVTDEDGVARFPYRAGLMPEPTQVCLSVGEDLAEITLAIPIAPLTYLDVLLVSPEEYLAYLDRQAAAAPIYTLSLDAFPQQLAADGGSLAMLTARLMHTDGTAAPGVPLIAEIISGEGDLIAEEPATDASGAWPLYYIAGFTPGTVTVQVMEPSTGLTAAFDLLLIEAGPARVTLFYLDPLLATPSREGAILPADGVTTLALAAEVTDLSGIPLPGVELKLEILDTGCGWLEVLDPISDAEGRVNFTYYAGTIEGPVRLRAFVAAGL